MGSPIQGESPSIADKEAKSTELRSSASIFTRNSALSVGRLLLSSALAFILPSYLSHQLPVTTYAAWVLILQVSAYVGYLEFGIQAGISKYVAEYEAKNDVSRASMRASAGLALMLIASVFGLILTLILAWQVPKLFHDMPTALYRDVRISIILVGTSLSFGLLCSIFSSIFFGLQRYAVPMIISLLNRVLFTTVVLATVALHQSLTVMGAFVAVTNVATGLLQFEAWRRYARKVRLSLQFLDRTVVREMLGYCSTLAIWTAGSLCVSGLDVTIVGRYDFSQTAFYSIASIPSNFMIAIIGAALAPLMPTASALSVHRNPTQMGTVLCRTTRYTTALLFISGLPLLVAGYLILRVWVGPLYATQTIGYLRILVLANIVRNVCLPYASMLIATESQKIATGGVFAEAVVNVTCSIYLVRHIGAIGVAYGTLIGSFVGVGVHLVLNMRRTKVKFDVSRVRLLFDGLIRPGVIALPSLLLAPYWWSSTTPTLGWLLWAVWGISTLLLAWFVVLDTGEQRALLKVIDRRLNPLSSGI